MQHWSKNRQYNLSKTHRPDNIGHQLLYSAQACNQKQKGKLKKQPKKYPKGVYAFSVKRKKNSPRKKIRIQQQEYTTRKWWNMSLVI